MPNPNPSSPPVRPLFIYGTLLSPRLLSVVLTGTSANAQLVLPLLAPARVEGFARRALHHKDYPAAVPSAGSRIHSYLLSPLTRSQRKKLDNFEGETYEPTSVTVNIVQGNINKNTAVDVIKNDKTLKHNHHDHDNYRKEDQEKKSTDSSDQPDAHPTSNSTSNSNPNPNPAAAAAETLFLPRLVQADIYIWRGDPDQVSQLPWDFELFEKERLDDWLDMFEEMPDLAGDSDQEE